MTKNYLTIEKSIESSMNINKSIFISEALEVMNHQEAMDFVMRIKERYPDANHHCWAYIIDSNVAFDDNGEPGGTAGSPILNVIKRNKLNNTIIVVTRYFGGKKLGVRGLIDAYRESAETAVEAGQIVDRRYGNIYELSCSYNYGRRLTESKDRRLKVISKEYTEVVKLKVFVELEACEEYESDFKNNNIEVITKALGKQ